MAMCLSASSNVMANMNGSSGTVCGNNDDDEIRDRHCIYENNIMMRSDAPLDCADIMCTDDDVIDISHISLLSEQNSELSKSDFDDYQLIIDEETELED